MPSAPGCRTILDVASDSADLRAYASMFRFDPNGFEQLESLPTTEAVTSVSTAQGERVVCIEQRKLHSGRDPQLEAKRYARGQNLEDIEVVVLFGYASGYVAHAIKSRARGEVLVYEPSLHVLREGLCHTPADPSIQVVTSLSALNTALDRLMLQRRTLRLLAWPPSARHFTPCFEQVADSIKDTIARLQRNSNTVHFRVQGWLHNYLTNLPQLAQHPNLTQYLGAFSDNPVIVCSAGPSLNQNAERLKALQGHCLILSVNTAARALAKMGIVPHGVVSVESLDISVQLEDIEWIDQVTGFLELTGNPNAFELNFRHTVPISVTTSCAARFSNMLAPGQSFAGGNSVANVAVALARKLGCPGIVLIGQDLAYKEDRVYADGTMFDKMRVEHTDELTTHLHVEAKEAIEARSQGMIGHNVKSQQSYAPMTLPAWGDPSQEVRTNHAFAMFQDWFVRASETLSSEGTWLINATEGGAHIPGWEELTLEQAIERHDLARAPQTPDEHVRVKLDTLAQQAPLSSEEIREQLQTQRQGALDVLRIVLGSQGLVNNDPDGDVMADDQITQRIEVFYHELVELMNRCPLLQDQITKPLNQLVSRQQVNTYNISKIIEEQIQELDQLLQATIEALPESTARKRAA